MHTHGERASYLASYLTREKKYRGLDALVGETAKAKFSQPPGGGVRQGDKGVGGRPSKRQRCSEKAPPCDGAFCDSTWSGDSSRALAVHHLANRGELVGKILPTGFDLVLNFRKAGVKARFACVDALLKSLETAGDGDGDVIGAFVNDALDLFEVFMV